MGILDGRAAVVTGAGRGIGRGIALLMAAEGAGVVVNDLGASLSGEGQDVGPAQEVVNEIKAAGGKAVANTGSVADFEQATEIIEQCVREFGRIDILVNVAGILRDRMIFNMTEAEWDAVIAVHLKGTFNCTRAASIHMRKAGYGRIISMASNSAYGAPGQPNYAAAKNGITGLMWSTANALSRYGVTANSILPSGATRMIDSIPTRREEALQKYGKLPSELAKGTELDPDNVAPLVVYLASEEAGYINGQVFYSLGYNYARLNQPSIYGVIRSKDRFTVEELRRLMPETIARDLSEPPFRALGQTIRDLKDETGQDLGNGIRFWKLGTA